MTSGSTHSSRSSSTTGGEPAYRGQIATVEQALAWLQLNLGSTMWFNRCENLCRQAYAVRGRYHATAGSHALAIPEDFRHGQSPPSPGDLILTPGRPGHIAIARDACCAYTNDVEHRGALTLEPLELVVRPGWFVADAWWTHVTWRRTHVEGGEPCSPSASSGQP